jgi:hypothetical protein
MKDAAGVSSTICGRDDEEGCDLDLYGLVWFFVINEG